MSGKIDLLNIESSPAIWDFRNSKKIPLYLMVRFNILQNLIDKEFQLSSPHQAAKLSIFEKFKYILIALIKNPFRSKRTSVIIFSSGAVNSKNDSGVYYNRLYQYFQDENTEDIAVIESSNKFSFSHPKKSNIFYRDALDILVKITSLLPIVNKLEKASARNFTSFLENSYDISKENIEKPLSKALAKYKAGYYIYYVFLKIKKPKLVIVEDASYGGLSYLIKAASDLGIKTAEYQHGYIGLNHPAYNFNCENIPKDYATFLPSVFLTHGEHWSKNCRVPAKKITIGYADLLKRIKFYSQKTSATATKDIVLFISGGTVPDKLVQFIKDFVALNNGSQVILRPHPSERPVMNERYKELFPYKVKLDTADLYSTLNQVSVIIGFEVSTVLYESIFFTQKIYLVDDEYANFYEPFSPFLRFSNPLDLTQQIRENKKLDSSANYFWADTPEANFRNYLKSELIEDKV